MKEYFSHDYHARSELGVIQMNHGLAGLGFYWCFVEMLHERDGSITESAIPSIAYELHADVDMCKTIINDYGLFVVDNGIVTCDRVLRNLKKRKAISEARRTAGKAGGEARWNKGTEEENSGDESAELQPEHIRHRYVLCRKQIVCGPAEECL